MKRLILGILIILTVINTGCGAKDTIIPKHGVSKFSNGLIKPTKGVNSLNINIDSGNLKIYCWDEKEIKYELKYNVRGNKSDEALEKMLKKYSIKSEEQDKALIFSVRYADKIKKAQDIYTDLELTIPKSMKLLEINQQVGTIIIEDQFEGNINAGLNSVNSEIKAMKGRLNYKCDTGNIRLNSGKLLKESSIDINAGNIIVKAECEEKSKYSFKTQVGNVDLSFPVNSNILLDSYGTVKNNQFTGINGDIEIEASTKMGKISVDGY